MRAARELLSGDEHSSREKVLGRDSADKGQWSRERIDTRVPVSTQGAILRSAPKTRAVSSSAGAARRKGLPSAAAARVRRGELLPVPTVSGRLAAREPRRDAVCLVQLSQRARDGAKATLAA